MAAVKSAFAMARNRIIRVALFSGVVNVLTLSGSIYMLQVYDRVLPTKSWETLIGLSVLLVISYALLGFFDSLRVRMLTRIGAVFDQSLQGQIYDCILLLRLRGWDTAAVTQPIRDLEIIRLFLSGNGPTALLDLPWVPFFLVILFLFHPIIALGAFTGMCFIVAFAFIIEWSTKQHTLEIGKLSSLRGTMGRITAYNAEVIHSLGMAEPFGEQWRGINHDYIEEIRRARDIEADIGTGAKVTRYILQSAILGLGAFLVITDRATAGIMIASSIVMGRALAPIEVTLATWKQFTGTREAFTRLTHMLQTNAAMTPPVLALPRPSERLTAQNLIIVPPGSRQIVGRDISLELLPGTGLAVLGASGSGKSSLARTLVGAWKPYQGVVSLDGAHLDQWHSSQLGKYIGYIPQDVALFEGTIAQNISRFDKNPQDSAIIEAAKLSGCHELITSFPEGYAKQIGENGNHLSAGQRQRIALARACYGNPFLVVMDEPNANLDVSGETALSETITRLRQRNCIVICISHRIALLSALDMAMVMSAGRIVASGPRDAVLSSLTARHEAPRADTYQRPEIENDAIPRDNQQS